MMHVASIPQSQVERFTITPFTIRPVAERFALGRSGAVSGLEHRNKAT
jgi:hypothetical protein